MIEEKPLNKLNRVNREHIKVKTAKQRKISSTRWLERQLNDPYYQLSKKEGYRSRASYKLIEINEKFKIFKPGQMIIDLGAAPGGWSQVAIQKVANKRLKGKVLAIDKLSIDPIEGVHILQKDFLDEDTFTVINNILNSKVEVILSDMAPSTSGDTPTDHLRILHLCEISFEFAKKMLKLNGNLVMKIFVGGLESKLLNDIKKEFKTVKHFKPNSSRKESKEMFLIAQHYKGNKND